MDCDVLANSECSSGCESGWTLYLDNSFVSPYGSYDGKCGFSEEKRRKDAEEEEEDLSVLSDASSGPPHFAEEGDFRYYTSPVPAALPKNSGKIKKTKENRRQKVHQQHPSSLLDDTASSPVFDISNNNLTVANNHDLAENVLDFSQGYSTTHFQGRPAFEEDKYCFLHSSLSGNYRQKNQWFQGRRR